MTQLVPSDTIVAQFPTTAKRIAVPATVLSIGTTLLDADTNVCACMFLKVRYLPGHVEAVGKVTVQVDPDLLLMYHALVPTVKLAVTVTGTLDSEVIAAVIELTSTNGCTCKASICFWISAT